MTPCMGDLVENSRIYFIRLLLYRVADELSCSVITASELNGPIVLRHELGHSIIDVGEEYDGGKHLLIDRGKALQCPNC